MKPTLNEQLARMQKLAGIIKENQGSNTNMLDFSSWKRIMGDDNIYHMVPPSKNADETLDIWVYPSKNKVMIASNDDIMIQTIADKYNSEVYQEMAPSIYQVNLKLTDLATLFPGQDFFLDDMNEGDTDYDRAKSAKRLGKKGEENIYGAGVKKGEEIEKEKMTKSKLKSKIKEMILAELNEDSTEDIDEPGALNNMYDPLAEAEEVELEDNNYDAEFLFKYFKNKGDLFIDEMREYDAEELMNSYPGLSEEEAEKLEDMLQNLAEAKKDKEEVEDITVDDTEVVDAPESDMMAGESAEVSGIQANLQAAYAEAKALGDEKLITQIANTITYFTKAHILDTAPINESQINEVLQNDDLIEGRMLDIDQEQLVSMILSFAENNPSVTLVDYLNNEFGYNDDLDNDDNYDDNMDVYDDSYPDMAEDKKAKDKLDQMNENMFPMLKRILR